MNTMILTKKFIYSVFAVALLATTVGCPPPAPPSEGEVDISTETIEVEGLPGDNTTAVTETPSDNMTAGGETP